MRLGSLDCKNILLVIRGCHACKANSVDFPHKTPFFANIRQLPSLHELPFSYLQHEGLFTASMLFGPSCKLKSVGVFSKYPDVQALCPEILV